MDSTKRLIRMSLTLGLMAFTGLILSDMALMDLHKGIEPGFNMAWDLVTVNSFITLLFIVISSLTILKLSKANIA